MFTHGTSGIYIQPMKVSAPDPTPIPIYSECTKITSFNILGFFRLRVKLGFDFPGVFPNKKIRSWSLNLYFEEEINPMLGSLKNSSSVKIPNFLQQNLKMPRNKFCFDKNMHPSMES